MLLFIPEISETILYYSDLKTKKCILNTCQTLRNTKRLWRKYIHYIYIFSIIKPINDKEFITNFLERYKPIPTSSSLHYLSSIGNLELLKWFYMNSNNITVFNPIHLLEYSVESGYLETSKWLYSISEINTIGEKEQLKKIIKNAAKYGHLHILQWIHNCTKEEIPIDTISLAAANGYLDVVKWIHNTKNYCSLRSIENASQNGFLHVVKWLYFNCHIAKKYIYQAMEGAAINGEFKVLEWLCSVTNTDSYVSTNYVTDYLYRRQLDKRE